MAKAGLAPSRGRTAAGRSAAKTAPPSLLARITGRPQLLAILCMAGLLPAAAANLLVLPGILPFAEAFGWASFRLGAPDFARLEPAHLWRAAFLAAAFVAFLAGEGRRLWLRLVLIAPLVLAALHPADRIGSAMDYRARLGAMASAEGFDTAVARARIDAIMRRQASLGGAFALLPPRLPATEWLDVRHAAATATVEGWRGLTGDLARRVESLRQQYREANDAFVRLDILRETPMQREQLREIGRALRAARDADRRFAAQVREAEAALAAGSGAGKREADLAAIDFAAAIDLHERRLADKENLYLALPYLAASLAVLGWFAWTFGLLNATARIVLGLWVAGSLANAAAWWGEWHLFAFAGLYPVAITALGTVCLRFVIRMWRDNADIFAALKPADRLGHHGKVALYFAPFLLVLVGIVGGKNYVTEQLVDSLYCRGEACGGPGALKLVDTDPGRVSLRDDVHFLASKAFGRLEVELMAAAAAAEAGTPEALEKARATAVAAFDAVFLPNIWDYSGPDAAPDGDACNPFKGFSISGCGYSIGMKGVNRAYHRQKSRAWAWYDDKLRRIEAGVRAAVEQGATGARENLDGIAADLAAQARRGIDATFLGFAGVSALQWALILMVCGRALLTIEARLIFRAGPGRLLPRVFHAMTPPDAAVDTGGAPTLRKTEKPSLKLTLAGGQQLLIRAGYDPDNASTLSAAIPPLAWRWTLSRFLSRTLWLKTMIPRRNADAPVISDSQGVCFVSVQVPEGSSVVFRWQNFVAMSNDAVLGRLLSLRLPFVVIGHVALPVIHGPARLVLRTHGVPKITTREGERPSVAPYRLLAWSQPSTFAVSSLDALDAPGARVSPFKKAVSVYVDDCQVLPASTAAAVLDAGQSTRSGIGILREFWKLLRL